MIAKYLPLKALRIPDIQFSPVFIWNSTFLCILLLASLLNLHVWHFGKKQQQITQSQIKEENTAVQTLSIPDAHLFGIMKNSNEIIISQLPIKIEGVFYAKENPIALLSIRGEVAKVYHLGDRILGVYIQKINPNSIILQSGEQLSKLAMPSSKLQFLPPPTSNEIGATDEK